MAAVVRVKRRLEDDPVDSLVLLCKKVRTGADVGSAAVSPADSTEAVKSVFKFSFTVAKPDTEELVSHCIKQTTRKDHIETRYRQSHKPAHCQKSQKHKIVASNARYKIVSEKRAVDSTELSETVSHDEPRDQSLTARLRVYDVEKLTDDAVPVLNESQMSGNVITCNDIPLVRETVSLPGSSLTSSSAVQEMETVDDDDDFVYDVYRTDDDQFDFESLEHLLAIRAFSEKEELWWEDESSEDEAAYDEDDENAENNWRNDYPDNDPMYFERLHLDDNYSSDDDTGRCYEDDDDVDDDRDEY